jgi:hypothetical protein
MFEGIQNDQTGPTDVHRPKRGIEIRDPDDAVRDRWNRNVDGKGSPVDRVFDDRLSERASERATARKVLSGPILSVKSTRRGGRQAIGSMTAMYTKKSSPDSFGYPGVRNTTGRGSVTASSDSGRRETMPSESNLQRVNGRFQHRCQRRTFR